MAARARPKAARAVPREARLLKAPRETLLAEELFRYIGRSRRCILLAAEQRLKEQERSILSWQVLCYLMRNGSTSQRDLAVANGQHPAGVSRLIDEMEAERLVRRCPDPGDRRRLLIEATSDGRAWFDEASPAVLCGVEEALAGLTRAQREDLLSLLVALVTGSRETDEGAAPV